MSITALPPAPSRTDPANFATKSDALLGALATFVNEANSLQSDVNSNAAAAAIAQAASAAAMAAANYKGVWTALSGALNIPASVFYNGNFWILTANVANVAAAEPGVSNVWEAVNGFRTPMPNMHASLMLDFVNSQVVSPRITFSRASTGTRFNKTGVLGIVAANLPRIDFDPTTFECKGLLLESASTNMMLYSDQLDNAAWNKYGLSVTANASLAPDGTNAMDLLVPSAVYGEHYVDQSISLTAGVTYTYSVFVKSGSLGSYKLYMRVAGISIANLGIDPATGTRTSVDTGPNYLASSVSNAGPGIYRIGLTFVAATTGLTVIRTQVLDAIGSSIFSGDTTSGIHVWGEQLEACAAPSSYIPTTTAAATRATDFASMTGANFSSWYRQDEGTFNIDFDVAATTTEITAKAIFAISDTSSANGIDVICGSGTIAAEVYSSGVAQLLNFNMSNITPNAKWGVAFAYKLNDIASCSNNGQVLTDISAVLPACTVVYLGGGRTGGSNMNGHLANLTYYPKRLSNTTLQALAAL